MSSRMSLLLLGSLQVTLDGATVAGFESDKVRALLIYLAVEHDRPHRRGALAGLLWPERPERAALLNLNQALANLRRAIGDREAHVPLILSSRDSLQFNPAADCTIDVNEFTRLVEACESHSHRSLANCAACAGRLERAAALYRGAFLEGFAPRDSNTFQEWAGLLRERLHRRLLWALDGLAAYHARRDPAAALRALFRQIELEPWREQAHRMAMELLWRDGQRSAALAQYERCRELLAAELGLDPDEQTTALYEQILGDQGRGAEEPPGAGPQPAPLPLPTTAFFGREEELARLAGYLSDPACRLITITGLGGSGKTRLALQAAAAHQEAFNNGACLVSLAPVRVPELLLPTIATALGLAPGGEDVAGQLAAHLRERELLLLLDNCEQLTPAFPTLATLLERAPRMVILATSRERLGLRGEWVLDLGGLELPAGHAVEQLAQSSATALFCQVALQASAGFAPDERDRAAIVHICDMLAGHPLAIELAAAWAPLLSCSEIEQELRNGLDLLAGQSHDLPERQRTITVVLDSSWQLLGEREQESLRRLAVFRGSFTREAAAAIAGATLPTLAALVARSLLARDENGRYALHEFVRQYALARLAENGEQPATGARLVAWCLELVEAAEPHLKGTDEVLWLERLAAEHNHMRAALEHSLTAGDVGSAARMAGVLRWFWYQRGHTAEGRSWLERILAAETGDATLPPLLRARLLQGAGIFADDQGDHLHAEQRYHAGLALYRELGDERGIQATTNSLGILAHSRGDYALAERHFAEGLAMARRLGNSWGIANGLNSLGTVFQARGEAAMAQAHFTEALTLARQAGYEALVVLLLDNLGEIALELGNNGPAAEYFTEALQRQRAMGDKRGAALSLNGLARLALARGDLAAAERHLHEGLALARSTASQRELATYLDNLAALHAARGEWIEAARLCGATAAFRERSGAILSAFAQARYQQTLAAARANLDETSFHTAIAAGRASSIGA